MSGGTRGRAPLAAAACLAAAFAVTWRFLGFTGFNNDHYVHLARAYQIWLGDWPVRDFEDPGMPLMYAVSAAARAIGGSALVTEWSVVTAAYALAAACTIVAAARLSGSMAIAALVTILEVAINPRSFGYPKLLLYAVAALVILSAARHPTAWRTAALALITAVAFLFRHDHGLFIGSGSLVTLLLANEPAGWRPRLGRIGVFAVWLTVFLAPWALFVESQIGLVDYFAGAVAFSRAEATIASLRAMPRFGWSVLDATGNALSWLFYLFHALPFVCLAVVGHRRRSGEAWPGESAAIVALSLIAMLVNATFMRDSLEGRIPDAVVPAMLLGAWLLGLTVRGSQPLWQPRTAFAAVLVLATCWAVFQAADVRGQLSRAGVLAGPGAVRVRAADLWDRLGKRLPDRDLVPSRYSRAMLPFLEYIHRCTRPDDRLMMTGLFPEVYVLAERGFAGGHVAFMPDVYTSKADQARTITRLGRQSVPFVLVVSQYEHDLRAEMPDLAAYLDERYVPMAHIPVPETLGVQVYVERRRQSWGIDPLTAWPCFSDSEPA
ncbi:MAG TPA: hypothetical protein VIX63_13810 [Vicinamibacterales bacterium]